MTAAPVVATGDLVLQDGVLPSWPSPSSLHRVLDQLRTRPPLVTHAECEALRHRLVEVAAGEGFVVQAGDCAEMFDEVSFHTTVRKAAQLTELAEIVEAATGRPTSCVGRIAGQFAKPRSCPVEPGPDGRPLPVYRGDAVNRLEPAAAARVADPERLLGGYDHALQVLAHLRAVRTSRPVHASHDALLVEYEQALCRTDPGTGARYGSSAHLLWVGERTRSPDGPHVALLAGVANPVAVKLGPTATGADLTALLDRVDPARQPGRVVLITRLGRDAVRTRLPELLAAAGETGRRPVWLCDPMHGNTVRLPDGRKTRVIDDIVAELRAFVELVRAVGGHPGGIHLEITPDDVTECVADTDASGAFLRYWTGCDPRLNPDQARTVVAAFTHAVRA